ncbi:hypothetical protein EIMP300_28800 [Escherichia coli]|uniref:DUF2235 domain-containing protein n=1 Tax=Escherichia coli TaxID=562 RepID=A0A8S0FNF7_ECOLX|nr:hypothetical protein EIMP300_28800 [Escherichia coli]
MISESVISAAVRAQQSEDGKVGNCGRIWHVAFFFDGVGRNIDRDATDCRLSNIARLFRAYPDEQKNTGDTCNIINFISPEWALPTMTILSTIFTLLWILV